MTLRDSESLGIGQTSSFSRTAKRRKIGVVDLEATLKDVQLDLNGSMFANVIVQKRDDPEFKPLANSQDRQTGMALVCWLSDETFIGLAELAEPRALSEIVRFHGSEAAPQCSLRRCGGNDCCAETAFVITMHLRQGKGKCLVRRDGLGDYVTFEGSALRFETTIVPGESLRKELFARHFSKLPDATTEDAVLCLGRIQVAFPHLSHDSDQNMSVAVDVETFGGGVEEDGYAGDNSEASTVEEDQEIENSIRAILPMMAHVTMPSPYEARLGFDDLLARGGTPVPPLTCAPNDVQL